ALTPRTICEVGCGAGEVLKQLQERLEPDCDFWGYDISPQAIELAAGRANDRLHFKVGDILREPDVRFDLILVLDVLEHLEGYFAFLRGLQPRSAYKIFHIPLDISVQTVLRPRALLKVRETYGHIHYFTQETALQTLRDAGYVVLDSFYTARALELPTTELPRRVLRLPRRLLFALHEDSAARILGGFSILALAQ
ncbi:MAG TPA: class I SAM-dependent methyltransferase, partial [Ktedonobacterales bacterium]|nr:class I SAM-dependent methyltransferase [Ktedonobacterales bacterium]